MVARLAALLVVAGLLGLPLPASASCAGPGLTVVGLPRQQPHLQPGATYEVLGLGFADGCDDTGGEDTGGGCSARGPQPRETVAPRRGLVLSLVQGARRSPSGARDADGRYEVLWAADLPTDLPPGPAVLEAGGARLPVVIDDARGTSPSRR